MIKRILALPLLVASLGVSSAEGLQDWGRYEPLKAEALERIEQHRKGDVTIKLLDAEGKAATNCEVRVELKRHDFKWGAVINSNFLSTQYAERNKENFLAYFNASGFGLSLKPKHRATEHEAAADEIMPWFASHDIYVRGHALTWESARYMRRADAAIFKDENLSTTQRYEKLREAMSEHFYHALPKWNVECWDVSNEPLGNNEFNNLDPAINSHAEWFKLAERVRRECGRDSVMLFQNDYQIISAITPRAISFKLNGYNSVGRPAVYREVIAKQIADGAKIDGIGFQSRLKGGLITPDSIYSRLCSFERFDLPYHATEFEIRDTDTYIYSDAERRLLTEYMMVIYFSHPRVEGFWHWTFSDSRESNPQDYSLFRYDGTPTINGEIWMDLMDSVFASEATLRSNSEGEITLRGYYGDYEIRSKCGDARFTLDRRHPHQEVTLAQ